MSSVGDAFAALKNVVLLHERLEGVRKDVERLDADLRGVATLAHGLNVRVAVIETMINMSGRGPLPPRIEG